MVAIITISFIIAIVCYKHTSTCICGNCGVQKKKKKRANKWEWRVQDVQQTGYALDVKR